jgi:hypothetical protein
LPGHKKGLLVKVSKKGPPHDGMYVLYVLFRNGRGHNQPHVKTTNVYPSGEQKVTNEESYFAADELLRGKT